MQNTPESSTGYVRLNEEVLRPGDVILVTQSSAISASIRLMIWSDISHAMVYVEDRSVIDATFAGVQASNTQRLWFEADRPVHALRLKTSPTPDQLQAIILDLRAKIGTRYSVPQVLATLVPAKISAGRRQFCSRLVARAFAAAGIKLVAKPDSCTPERLKRSALLAPVPNATVPVSEDEMDFFETIPDLPKIMRNTTNTFLAGVRTIASKVEDFQAPGHTPGHQVLLVKPTGQQPVLIAGDLWHSRSNYAHNRVPRINWSRKATLQSFRKVRAIANKNMRES